MRGTVRALSAIALSALAVAACGSSRAAPARVSACASPARVGVLPQWARAGFGESMPRMPYELGNAGDIAAIFWGLPLRSPPPRTYANKILWVSRVAVTPGSDLRIAAQRMQGSRAVGAAVSRTVTGGPSPSIIDLPSPGCWRFTLRWSGRVDSLDVHYAPGPTS